MSRKKMKGSKGYGIVPMSGYSKKRSSRTKIPIGSGKLVRSSKLTMRCDICGINRATHETSFGWRVCKDCYETHVRRFR